MNTIKALLAVSVLAAAGAANAANVVGTFDVTLTGNVIDTTGDANLDADGNSIGPGIVGHMTGTGKATGYDDGSIVIALGDQVGVAPYATLDVTVYGSRIIDELHFTASFSPSGFDANGATYTAGQLTTTYCGEIPNITSIDPNASGFCDPGLTGDIGSPVAFDTATGNLSMATGGVFNTTQLLGPGGEFSFGRDFVLSNFQAVSEVPVPAAAWLFGSGLLGLAGAARRRAA